MSYFCYSYCYQVLQSLHDDNITQSEKSVICLVSDLIRQEKIMLPHYRLHGVYYPDLSGSRKPAFLGVYSKRLGVQWFEVPSRIMRGIVKNLSAYGLNC